MLAKVARVDPAAAPNGVTAIDARSDQLDRAETLSRLTT
jgi:hypothetical protein